VVAELPSLRQPNAEAVIRAVFAGESRKGFRLVHYSIRPDHMHLVCEAESALALARGVQRIASRIARAVNALLGRAGRLFADRYHGRVLGTPREARSGLRYCLLNAHKDAAKRGVRMTGLDPYSSGRWFDGWGDVPPPRAPPYGSLACPVAPAASWLLVVGWRRHHPPIATTELSLPAPFEGAP
jgi:REP element-mobilizing transposase RayT